MALIYIVEDDESIREIETIALKNSGHMVGAFGSSKEFFKKLDEILPTLCCLMLCFLMKVVMTSLRS